MKKLFKELFYVPKYGKVREKVMLVHVALSVSIIVMCLAAMSLSAYAFFTYNVTSSLNTIKAANFEAKVDIQIADKNGEPIAVTASSNNTYTAELEAKTAYYITLQATDRSTAKTGFVIITAENCDSKYHTEQLSRDENGNAKTVTFWLEPSANTTVTFHSRWGTSSFYSNYIQTNENTELYILTGDRVQLSVNPVKYNAPPLSNTNGTTPANTTTLPATEDTTPPAQTISSETAGTSEPTIGTEPSSTTAPSVETDVTKPIVTKPSESEATVTEPSESEATVAEPSETTAPTEPMATQPTASTEISGTKETKQNLPTAETTEETGVPATETNNA